MSLPSDCLPPLSQANQSSTVVQLPEMVTLARLFEMPRIKPAEIIEGLLYRRSKMMLCSASKAGKTWILLNMALSVASGTDFLGKQCTKSKVLYINLELDEFFITERAEHLVAARPAWQTAEKNLFFWNLRGKSRDFSELRKLLEGPAKEQDFGLIIIDPIYKVLGNRDENSNGEIGDLMNELEAFALTTGAALVFAHHFAKGNASGKQSIDRMSGAGAWARDADSIITLTPHEEDDCYTFSATLRNHPKLDDFVVRWRFPIMEITDLDPTALLRPQMKSKTKLKAEFSAESILAHVPMDGSILKNTLKEKARKAGIPDKTSSALIDQCIHDGTLFEYGIKRKGTNAQKVISRKPQPEPNLV